MEGARATAAVKATSVMIERSRMRLGRGCCSRRRCCGRSRACGGDDGSARRGQAAAHRLGGGLAQDGVHRSTASSSPTPRRASPSRAPTSSRRRSSRASSPTSSPPPTPSCPTQLYAKGLVEKPTVFAGNRLVLAVPAEGAKVDSLDDLEGDGVDARHRRQGRADRLLHAHRAREAAGRRSARRSSATCAPRSPTWPASPASSPRARSTPASLHLRRARDRRQAEGDRAARRRCSRRSPTAPRSSRAPSSPSRRRRSSPACSTARAPRR